MTANLEVPELLGRQENCPVLLGGGDSELKENEKYSLSKIFSNFPILKYDSPKPFNEFFLWGIELQNILNFDI